jgi:hypothetical protein
MDEKLRNKLDQPAMLMEITRCSNCPFGPDNSGYCELDSNVTVNYRTMDMSSPPNYCPLRNNSYLVKIADAVIAAGEIK